ncbi:MAG: iron ABC transporter permease [Bryobacteraceae bacterium]
MTTPPALPPPVASRLARALAVLTVLLAGSVALGLWLGTEKLDLTKVLSNPIARALFFQLRLPRVLTGALIGAALAATGAALQALFRNPLADPYTLGVSGGGAVGASIALALGWSAPVLGVPLVYVAAFAGAMVAMVTVRTIARTGVLTLPGALLLAGVVVNLTAYAAVLTIQYVVDPNSALRMLRFMTGSLDVVGMDGVWRMAAILVPAFAAMVWFARPLHLMAIDEDTAATLGVDTHRTELAVHTLCSLVVGLAVANGGAIGFVGLIVPHGVRAIFGEDVRVVLPASLVAGAAFLVLADTLARTALPGTELPVGAITGLLGGPMFLWLLRRRQRYSAL